MIDLQPWAAVMRGLKRGDTARVNHNQCTAGADNRKRLYLTRSAGTPNLVMGYCHNCQDKGFHSLRGLVAHKDFDPLDTSHHLPTCNGPFEAPKNMDHTCANWPTMAQQWRISMKLEVCDCEAMGIAYDPATHRIYLPQWTEVKDGAPTATSVLQGYQLRNLTEHGPKYLTAHRDKRRVVSTELNNTNHDSILNRVGILVEDLSSGIRVAKALRHTNIECRVIVNYGTKVSPEVLHRARVIDTGMVWLDNDSEHVIEQAEKIRNVWGMLSGKRTTIETKYRDPKHVALPDILNTVRRHIG